MQIEPNTSNQIRFRDAAGDEAWFDIFDDTEIELVVTTKTYDGIFNTVALAEAEVDTLVSHLRPSAGGHVCGECGTTEAETYVTTTLDREDSKNTRTELCRACDDELRLRPLLDQWQEADRQARPTTSDEDWGRDDEEAELVADTYYYAATGLAEAVGLPYLKEI